MHPYNDDHMVINIRYDEWMIKGVLMDQGSSLYIIY